MSFRQVAPITAVAAKATGAKAAAASPRKPSPPCSSGCVGTSLKLRLDNLNAKKVHSSHLQRLSPSKNWNRGALTSTAYQPATVNWKFAPEPCPSHGVASTKPLYDATV